MMILGKARLKKERTLEIFSDILDKKLLTGWPAHYQMKFPTVRMKKNGMKRLISPLI
jgi:hypothetical protein